MVEAVIQAFRKKTGLDAQYWRASAMIVMNRSMSEYRAGNPIYDVVLNNSDPLLIMHQEGMIGKYDSTVMQKYPKDQIDPRLGPISRYGIVGVLYNKEPGQAGRRSQGTGRFDPAKIQRHVSDGRSDSSCHDDSVAQQLAQSDE